MGDNRFGRLCAFTQDEVQVKYWYQPVTLEDQVPLIDDKTARHLQAQLDALDDLCETTTELTITGTFDIPKFSADHLATSSAELTFKQIRDALDREYVRGRAPEPIVKRPRRAILLEGL